MDSQAPFAISALSTPHFDGAKKRPKAGRFMAYLASFRARHAVDG